MKATLWQITKNGAVLDGFQPKNEIRAAQEVTDLNLTANHYQSSDVYAAIPTTGEKGVRIIGTHQDCGGSVTYHTETNVHYRQCSICHAGGPLANLGPRCIVER